MRAELIDSKSKKELLEQELHTLLLQLHSAQLSHLPGINGRVQDSKIDPDVNIIRKKLQEELKKSPSHRSMLLFYHLTNEKYFYCNLESNALRIE